MLDIAMIECEHIYTTANLEGALQGFLVEVAFAELSLIAAVVIVRFGITERRIFGREWSGAVTCGICA